MDAARAAVHKITSRTGHRTDVDEVVNPAVVSETIKPHRHEETQEAIDREVHQDHYHTTVQPIAHRETLPEQHKHNMLPQVNREFRHDNERETQQRVSAELGAFKNTQTVAQTTTSRNAAPSVTGEHVHHHVHETVQPVIHKETIQPEVIHTTIPIHETHIASAQHHGMSALPMKTLDEFTRAGGVIQGTKSHTHEEYDGAPRPYNEKLRTSIDKVLPGTHGTAGAAGTAGGVGALGTTGRHRRSSSASSSDYEDSRKTRDSGIGGVGSDKHTSSTGQKKPSLMDKLNPRVDANGDGKPGFMK